MLCNAEGHMEMLHATQQVPFQKASLFEETCPLVTNRNEPCHF